MIDDATFIRASREATPSLYRISVSLLGSVPDAQDAVQQGLMKGWAARGRARPGSEKAWLTRIVINECRNIQRYRMRVTPVERMAEGAWEPPDPALRDALDALPEKLRLPLLMRYMEGMTEREAAEALRLTVPAVKSRLHRARKALKALLEVTVP